MAHTTANSPAPALAFAHWEAISTGLAWIYEGTVSPEYRELHTHISGQSAFLIRRGQLIIRTEAGETIGETGEWVFPRQGMRFQKFSPDAKILSIHFHLTWPDRQNLFAWDNAIHFQSSDHPSLESSAVALLATVSELPSHQRTALRKHACSFSTYLKIHQQFIDWMTLFAQVLEQLHIHPSNTSKEDARIEAIREQLDRYPLNEPARLDWLRKQAGISNSQISRLFVQQYGCTPKQYLDRRRLETAAFRIKHSADSIKTIAYELGFSSPSHFSRWLRSKIHISPVELRNTSSPSLPQ